MGQRLGKAGYHAIAFDARGHGDSDWAADGRYDQDAMVEDLQRILSRFDERPPVLVGASMGGGTSLVAVGEGHIHATALVLVDIAPRVEPAGVEKIRAFMSRKPEGFDSLEEVADAISRYQPHRARPSTMDGLAKNVRIDAHGKYRWHWDPRFRSRAGFDLEQRQQRLEACARRIAIPTLLVRGGLSDVLSNDGARAFLELCPHCQLHRRQECCSHMIAGDRNDVFGNAVIDFLGRAVPALSR